MIKEICEHIHWLGHDGYRMELGGKQIYIDPYQIADGLPAADIILVTHEHYDHCSPEDIAKIANKKTIFVTEPMSAKKLQGDVRLLAPGERLEIDGIGVAAVPSYNLDKKFHPKKNNWLGFMVTVDGVTIYHAGDTDHIPEMKDFTADIALLPVSGTYVMTAGEAVAAALDINPQIAIPMHYGALVGTADDARAFAEGLAGRIEVKILP